MSFTREQKVDLVYGGLATAAAIATLTTPVGPLLLASRLIGIGAVNLLGAECTKTAMGFFDRWGYQVKKTITVNGTTDTTTTN